MVAKPADGVLTKLIASASRDHRDADCYLPDFAAPGAVIALVLISVLVAMALTLAQVDTADGFFLDLGRNSLLMLWMTLGSASVLTLARPVLVRRSAAVATCFGLGLVLACVAVVSEMVVWLGHYFSGSRLVDMSRVFPSHEWEFLARNLLLGTIITAGVLRYFYVTHQWRRNVESEAESRISALQARIRPHFLFNSMNTIASLTRSDPAAAERAVEDLADLFRASLSNPGETISLGEEIEVARVYQRMEQQRLGERLKVDWQLDGVPLQARVPGLTLQPLLENAIYHGIEPRADGGVVTVTGRCDGDTVSLAVSNPLPDEAAARSGGHRIALDNIRQRLELAYGRRARMEIERTADRFEVLIVFPLGAHKDV